MKLIRIFLNKKLLLQYTAAFTCTLITICSGLHYGWASPALPILLDEDTPIPITNDESSWVAIIYLIGGPCGAAFTGIVIDLLGRKTVLLLSSVPFFISWMMIAFARSLPELLIARFVAGFSDGLIFGATPIYFSEIADPKIRGFLGCSIMISYLIGTMLTNITGSYLSIQNAALLCSSIPVVFVLTFAWMPETPYYLLLKGKKDQARRSLMKLKCSSNVDEQLEAISKAIEEEKETSARFFDIFKKTNGKSLLIVLALRGAQQLSGVVAFTFYAQTVFEEAGDSLSPLLCVVILYCVQIAFSALSSLFIDKLGRRPLLIISIVGSCLALFAEGVYFALREVWGVDLSHISWISMVVLIVFIISFSVGLQAVPLFMFAEIFPTNVKAYAAAFSDIFYFIFAAIASKFFQLTKDQYGMYVPFFAFSVCCLLGVFVIVYFVPETKNKTLEHIQIELKNKN